VPPPQVPDTHTENSWPATMDSIATAEASALRVTLNGALAMVL
jgi:hypothetical protein